MELWMILIAQIAFALVCLRPGGKKEDGGPAGAVVFSIALAGGFAIAVAIVSGFTASTQFMAGYATEWVLSVDNLMAIYAVFKYFGIPARQQGRVLSYGLISAAAFRLLFTVLGVGMSASRIGQAVVAALVMITAVSVWKGSDDVEVVDHNKRWYVRGLRRWFRISGTIPDGGEFFVKSFEFGVPGETGPVGRRIATPMLPCLVAVEITDLMFSFDSVPAVISISSTPVIIYAAMLFAIIGLRQMYFMMPAAEKYFKELPQSVAAVLVLVAIKMFLAAGGISVPTWLFMVLILVILSAGLSYSISKQQERDDAVFKK